MRFSRSTSTILGLLFLGASCGCGSAAGSLPSLIPVKGKVTFKGQPLTKGVITFDPTDYGRAATGQLQADGTYVLTTYKDGDGIVAGLHKISIAGVDKKIGSDRVFKKFMSSGGPALEAEVSPDKTEFNIDIK